MPFAPVSRRDPFRVSQHRRKRNIFMYSVSLSIYKLSLRFVPWYIVYVSNYYCYNNYSRMKITLSETMYSSRVRQNILGNLYPHLNLCSQHYF